jgi:hypothetical protein
MRMGKKRMREGEMSKGWRSAGWAKRGCWLLAVSIIALTGCKGFLLTYKGAVVRDGYLIALTDGTQRGARYESPDLTIDYQVLRNGDDLQLSGLAKFTPAIRNAFTMISYFDLSVFFTDAQGKILEERRIATPGSDDPEKQMRIREKLLLPPGTANMAFSYNGQARDNSGAGEDRGSGEMPFWQIPIVR